MPGVDKVAAFCCAFDRAAETARKALIMPLSEKSNANLAAQVQLEESVYNTIAWLDLLSEKLIAEICTGRDSDVKAQSFADGIRNITLDISEKLHNNWEKAHGEWRAE